MTKSITSKHQYFFSTEDTQCVLLIVTGWTSATGSSIINCWTCHVCVWGCVSVCAVKNFMYVWSENDILLCATHLCQTCLTGPRWHCAFVIYVHNYNIDIISPLCPCSTAKIYILVPVFSPLAVQNLLIYNHYVPLQFLVYVHVATVVYIHNSRIIHPLIIYHCPHFNAHFISNFLAWLIYRLSLLIHNPDSINLVQLSPCLQR